ncbi:Puromycin resistance protein pur8 [Frankia canadensis]|uniref:Puromycin resistance protein pur8 n=1 Tax=Frankia canadensis TaxID=1836972 RepID=A0A2I2L1X2_9ACTN|nr:MFS transporter [Frankia canadensis]SNQ51920.1 Puromycin resistance protein pur8 [Frankia canadensis]SOU59210.1 Puromycin resistance protein pur8 [Frankia canadensis]
MTETVQDRTSRDPVGEADGAPDPRRWLALSIIAVAQLMVVLDASIVNIAMPHAQSALHISTANRQWMVTAYTLAFGGLLLLGGRIADYLGRKRAFIWGLIGFALASALGGVAPNAGLLFAARALQGAFAAVLAPAALSLITVTFTESKERARAFGVFGAISGGGAAIGLIVGGVLTEYASWRWCLLVNVPIALVTAFAAAPVVRESRAEGEARYDLPGALTVTAGLIALVYGFTLAAEDGWSDPRTLGLLIGSVVLLAAFVVIESRSTAPLLPLRVAWERNRGGSFLASLLIGAGLFAMFLFLTYYFQQTLGYSALKTGFAFLPFSAGIIVSAGLASQLLPRFGPGVLAGVGTALAAVGMALLLSIGIDTGYASHVLPSELLISFGMGLSFVPLSSLALVGVAPHDAGVASALVNTTQQIGGSLGTALLNTVYATAVTNYIADHGTGARALDQSQIEGYTTAFLWGAVLIAAAAVVIVVLIRAGRDTTPAPDAAPAHVG